MRPGWLQNANHLAHQIRGLNPEMSGSFQMPHDIQLDKHRLLCCIPMPLIQRWRSVSACQVQQAAVLDRARMQVCCSLEDPYIVEISIEGACPPPHLPPPPPPSPPLPWRRRQPAQPLVPCFLNSKLFSIIPRIRQSFGKKPGQASSSSGPVSLCICTMLPWQG